MYRSGSGYLYRARARVSYSVLRESGACPGFFLPIHQVYGFGRLRALRNHAGVTLNHFIAVDNPEAYIQAACSGQGSSDSQLISFRFEYEQYYLEPVSNIVLVVVAECVGGTLSSLAVGQWRDEMLDSLAGVDIELRQWAGQYGLPLFNIEKPVALEPIAIPKPWGREIWYTGIEARGQSRVTDGVSSIPLPWLLAVAPQSLAKGRHRQLNLLKILDPLPEEVYGDLYFEQHQEKQEVYVVTHVDELAWPDGRGGICIGFDPAVRSEFSSDDECKIAFSEAVKEYEIVRRQVDERLDECRVRDGIGANEPVMADTAKRWLETLPAELLDRELALRKSMDRFKGVKALEVGDVLKVPTHTPHSLMHGVRTIEFQTPVYERQIISFAQKVLTQSHWDTDQALGSMQLDVPDLAVLNELGRGEGYLIEEVVDFDSFFVWRLTLQPNSTYEMEKALDYALAIGVSGWVSVESQNLREESAVMIPANLQSVNVVNNGSSSAVLLLSFPK